MRLSISGTSTAPTNKSSGFTGITCTDQWGEEFNYTGKDRVPIYKLYTLIGIGSRRQNNDTPGLQTATITVNLHKSNG